MEARFIGFEMFICGVKTGMKTGAYRLHHLGIDNVVCSSILAEANRCRPQEAFTGLCVTAWVL